MNFLINVNGKITGYYQGDHPGQDIDGAYEPYTGDLSGEDLTRFHYWSGSEVLPKQHFTLGAIPLPATASIEGIEYPLAEQPTFEFDRPGTYEITVDAGPAYYVETFTVDHSA